MPKYKVDTDQGSFVVELDQPPSDMGQMRDLITQHLVGENKKFVSEGNQVATQLAAGPERRSAPPMDQILTPQQLEQRVTAGGFAQPAMPTQQGVMDTLNKPFQVVGDVAGKAVQDVIDPVQNPNLSAAAGALTNAAVQTFAPGAVARGGQMVTKGVVSILPGSQAAKMEGAIDSTRGVLASKSETAAKRTAGFERAVSKIPAGEQSPLPKTLQAIDRLISKESGAAIKDGGLLGDLNALKSTINANNDQHSLGWIDSELTRIGQKTKSVQGQQANPAYKELFAAMADDLESTTKANSGRATVTPTGRGAVIRAKDKTIRNEKGWEDLTEEFEKLVKTKRGMGGQEDINANQLLDKLKNKPFLKESLRPEDWKDVEVIFKKLADMAPLPPPRGAMFGAGRFAGTAGGIASPLTLMGVDPGTAMAVGGTTAAAADVLRLLLPRPWGRKALRAVLESGPLNQAKIDSLNQIARLAENESTAGR